MDTADPEPRALTHFPHHPPPSLWLLDPTTGRSLPGVDTFGPGWSTGASLFVKFPSSLFGTQRVEHGYGCMGNLDEAQASGTPSRCRDPFLVLHSGGRERRAGH